MLTAKQHNRRFWARVASLIYLFLLLAASGQYRASGASTSDTADNVVIQDLHPGGLPLAVLPMDDDRPAPDVLLPALLFRSPHITNAFFSNPGKWHVQTSRCIRVKRYLLFSRLQLSDDPPLA